MRVFKSLVNGTRGVEQQIMKKSLQMLAFKVECSEVNLSAAAEKFCNSLFSSSTFVNSEDVLYSDKSKFYSDISNNFTYNKCAYKHHIYTSIDYNRSQVYDDSNVKLLTGQFCEILEIIRCKGNKCKLKLRELDVAPLKVINVNMHHIWNVIGRKQELYAFINEIKCKVISMNINNYEYVAVLPNKVDVL